MNLINKIKNIKYKGNVENSATIAPIAIVDTPKKHKSLLDRIRGVTATVQETPLHDMPSTKGINSPQDSFCPLQFLLERDIGIADLDPAKGILLATGGAYSQDMLYYIEFHVKEPKFFYGVLNALDEKRAIEREVTCVTLDAYRQKDGNVW